MLEFLIHESRAQEKGQPLLALLSLNSCFDFDLILNFPNIFCLLRNEMSLLLTMHIPASQHDILFLPRCHLTHASNIDSNQEDFSHTTTTEDKDLEFSWALAKNMPMRSNFFFTLRCSMATLIWQQRKWQCPWGEKMYLRNKKIRNARILGGKIVN